MSRLPSSLMFLGQMDCSDMDPTRSCSRPMKVKQFKEFKKQNTCADTSQSVNFLPFADMIICLGNDGQILEQGSFHDLRAAGGHVQQLLDKKRIDVNIVLPPVNYNMPVENRCSQKLAGVEQTSARPDTEADTSRQLGDMSTYVVYFSCLGWVLVLLFWLLQASYAFLMVFPGKRQV